MLLWILPRHREVVEVVLVVTHYYSSVNLYKLGDKFQVNEQPKIKIKLFKKIWGQIKTIIDEYLQDAVASDEVDAFETLASINDSIETYMPTGFHVFQIFSSYNTFFFQAFYDVAMPLFSLMDRRAQKKVKTL